MKNYDLIININAPDLENDKPLKGLIDKLVECFIEDLDKIVDVEPKIYLVSELVSRERL